MAVVSMLVAYMYNFGNTTSYEISVDTGCRESE